MSADDAAQHRTPATPRMSFVLVSDSGALTARDLDLMALALRADQPSFAAAWGRAPATFHAAGALQDAHPGAIVLRFVDLPTEPGALAWHSEDADGVIVTEIAVQAVLGDGGGVLDGGTSGESVLSAAHHEAIETQVDPAINLWADRFDGTQVAYEACDPVQGSLLPMTVRDAAGDAVQVQLSNYVFPAWFDPQAPAGSRFDALGQATGPFALTTGGYQVLRSTGPDLPEQWGRRAPSTDRIFAVRQKDHLRLVEFGAGVPAAKRARVLRRVATRLHGRPRAATPRAGHPRPV